MRLWLPHTLIYTRSACPKRFLVQIKTACTIAAATAAAAAAAACGLFAAELWRSQFSVAV